MRGQNVRVSGLHIQYDCQLLHLYRPGRRRGGGGVWQESADFSKGYRGAWYFGIGLSGLGKLIGLYFAFEKSQENRLGYV